MTIKDILVPVDFSESTAPCVAFAVELAKRFSARITLFHVLQIMHFPGSEPMFAFEAEMEALQRETEKQLRSIASSITPAVEVHTAMETGVPWDRIVARASDDKVDLIVVGTHGRSGLKHVLLGSVAGRVVRHAPCAVLVVRDRPRRPVPDLGGSA